MQQRGEAHRRRRGSARRRAARPAARGPPPRARRAPARPVSQVRHGPRAPRACGRGRRGGGRRSARRRAARPAPAARRRSGRSSSISSSPSTGRSPADDPLELGEHPLGGDPLELRRALGAPPRAVSGSISSSSSTAMRAARSVRSGSSASALGADHPQPPRLEVGAAAVRVEQLAAGQRLGHRVDREVAGGEVGAEVVVAQASRGRRARRAPRPTTRQAPNAPESCERRAARPRGDRARRRLGSPASARSRSAVVAAEQAVAHRAADDPRGSPPASAVARGLERRRSWRVGPRHPAGDPAGDLVVDRAEPPRALLGEDPLAALARRSARPPRRPRPRRRRRGRP